MNFICNYNEDTDLGTVLEGLEPDLARAIEEGVVASTGVAGEYNGIDDPTFITGRIEDVFQAIDAQKSILANGRKSDSTATTMSTPQGESE